MKLETELGKIGLHFDDFLEQQGLLKEVTVSAVRQVVACQLRQCIKELGLTKTELARRIHTSRAQLDQLLDPDNDAVTPAVLERAAKAVSRTLKVKQI